MVRSLHFDTVAEYGFQTDSSCDTILVARENEPMTNEAQRKIIKKLIQLHTKKMTRSKKTARAGLIREGIYNKAGELTVQYGGDAKPEPKRKKA
jgi:hypothetical protein